MHVYSHFLKYFLAWSKLTSMPFSDTAFPFLFYLTYFSFFLLLLSTDTQSNCRFGVFLVFSANLGFRTLTLGIPVLPHLLPSHSLCALHLLEGTISFLSGSFFIFYQIALYASAKGAILVLPTLFLCSSPSQVRFRTACVPFLLECQWQSSKF